ncbi:MAG: hypothetical protein JXK05_00410 [Campylobacterales bacterium]|nr:hypothetical protein [Campylobacterales bacterium]
MSRWLWALFAPVMLFGDGGALFEKHCTSCHVRHVDFTTLAKNFMESNNTLLNLKAPALNQIRFRVMQRVGDPEGDAEFHRIEVTGFISDYVLNPDRDKSVCMPEVMRFFETMESLKGKIGEEELQSIAEWIYEGAEQ